ARVKPLSFGKKQKQRKPERGEEENTRGDGENAAPVNKETGARKRLRSFKLARTDTTKERAALRAKEVLPDVVVRPPSQSQHTGYAAYTFR
ncbi:hypothetical protein EWM64_g7575, partial [Hericium alpestre]